MMGCGWVQPTWFQSLPGFGKLHSLLLTTQIGTHSMETQAIPMVLKTACKCG
jgi:hypothetical protein